MEFIVNELYRYSYYSRNNRTEYTYIVKCIEVNVDFIRVLVVLSNDPRYIQGSTWSDHRIVNKNYINLNEGFDDKYTKF